jgi:hypothetical protein
MIHYSGSDHEADGLTCYKRTRLRSRGSNGILPAEYRYGIDPFYIPSLTSSSVYALIKLAFSNPIFINTSDAALHHGKPWDLMQRIGELCLAKDACRICYLFEHNQVGIA